MGDKSPKSKDKAKKQHDTDKGKKAEEAAAVVASKKKAVTK